VPDPFAVEPSGTPATAGDQIRLVLPADSDYGRIARIAASSLALRLGFGFGEIEYLRIAVDETVILLLRPEGGGDITIEFTIQPDALVIDASTVAPSDGSNPLDEGARSRFDEIVADTVDVAEVDEHTARVHLVKRY
jgi:hypothetical protein